MSIQFDIPVLKLFIYTHLLRNTFLRTRHFLSTTFVLTPHQYVIQRYIYRVLQTIQMKHILLCVWAEPAVLGRAKTALKFKYEI